MCWFSMWYKLEWVIGLVLGSVKVTGNLLKMPGNIFQASCKWNCVRCISDKHKTFKNNIFTVNHSFLIVK